MRVNLNEMPADYKDFDSDTEQDADRHVVGDEFDWFKFTDTKNCR